MWPSVSAHFYLFSTYLRVKELIIEENDRSLQVQGWYMRGEMPDGTEVVDHKRRAQVKAFEFASKGTPHK